MPPKFLKLLEYYIENSPNLLNKLPINQFIELLEHYIHESWSEDLFLNILKKLSPDQLAELRNSDLLHKSVKSARFKVIKILLDYGFDINKFDDYYTTPLRISFSANEIHVMNYLIENGAKLHFKGGHFALILNLHPRHDKIVRNLFEQFFYIGIRDKFPEITKNNSIKFESMCKFSLACKRCIIDKLFDFL